MFTVSVDSITEGDRRALVSLRILFKKSQSIYNSIIIFESSVDGWFASIEHIFRCFILSLSTNWFNSTQFTKYGPFNIGAWTSQNLSVSFASYNKLSLASWRWSLQFRGKSPTLKRKFFTIKVILINFVILFHFSVIYPMSNSKPYCNVRDLTFTDYHNGVEMKSNDVRVYFKDNTNSS